MRIRIRIIHANKRMLEQVDAKTSKYCSALSPYPDFNIDVAAEQEGRCRARVLSSGSIRCSGVQRPSFTQIMDG